MSSKAIRESERLLPRLRRHKLTVSMLALTWIVLLKMLYGAWRGEVQPGIFAGVILLINAPVFMFAVVPLVLVLHFFGAISSPSPFSATGLGLAILLAPIYWWFWDRKIRPKSLLRSRISKKV